MTGFEPLPAIGLALAAFLHTRRAGRLARRGRPVPLARHLTAAPSETEATAAAVVEVARCQACGERTLALEHDDEPRHDALAH